MPARAHQLILTVIKRRLLCGVVLPAFFAGPAMAADMAVKAPPPAIAAPTAYNWTGFYDGLNAGGAFASSGDPTTSASCSAAAPGFAFPYFSCPNAALVSAAGTGSMSDAAFTGGVQAGYNWQNGAGVIGIETDFESFNVRLSRSASMPYGGGGTLTITNSADATWLFTARARAGWAFDRYLAYVTGGLAVTDLHSNNSYIDTNPGPGPGAGAWGASSTKAGWTVGAGLEYALSNNWTAKIEYLYVHFDTINASGIVTAAGGYGSAINTATDLSAQIARAGVNYKF